MNRREAVVYLAGLVALEVLQLQPDQELGTPQSSTLSLTQTSSPAHVGHTQPSVSNYVSLAYHCAIENGLDPACFIRQINQESGFQPVAYSSAGAIGIAQFMPETAAGLGIDPHDPVASLQGAARLMAHYLAHYGSYAMALAAYNAGSGAVAYAVHHGGAHWLSWLPLETQHYIAAILG